MTSTGEYKRHYEQFSQNVDFAARIWHYHAHLNNRANENPEVLAALNKSPGYWRDQRYTAIQTTVIFLGKIFDNDGRVYNVDKVITAAKAALSYFSKDELRKRKIGAAGEFEAIDEYIKNAKELNESHLRSISSEIKKAKIIWKRLKPLRDKIYAHNEILSDDERSTLLANVRNADINDILQILLNISNSLWQSEFNGREPDFTSNHTQPIEWAKKSIDSLIESLLHS